MTAELDQLCINTVRFLSVDAVQKADSGHPGMPLGAAPMAYVLWTRLLKHNPRNPVWFDRDRFVLSAGHGSMLLYSLLHLTGYDLSLDELKQFRQWGSKTPGHPERRHTPGVEITTGPLGQGFANAVGMAIAEAQLAARYNRPGFQVVDHATYAIVSDGDLMEGVASEAASLAGHLRLGKLTCLYDNNHVSLAASTDITFTEDRARRFEAYGWHTVSIADGNDLAAIEASLQAARAETERPSLVLVRTHIGYGSPKQDSFEAHGAPLGADGVRLTKQRLGWPPEPPFLIPEPALAHFREAVARGARDETAWNDRMAAYAQAFPDLADELRRSLEGELPPDWDADIPVFPADAKGIATRAASGKVMNAIAPRLPALTGGSADLDPSTYTALEHFGDFNRTGRCQLELCRTQSAFRRPRACDGRHRQRPGGAWWHHSVRRDVPGFFRLYASTDPAGRADGAARRARVHARQHRARRGRPHTSARGAAGSAARDSESRRDPAGRRQRDRGCVARGAGEARQPRSAGINPAAGTHARSQPLCCVGRRAPRRYVLSDARNGHPELILIASGSEVGLILAAAERLQINGIEVRCVSMPSWEMFDALSQEERDAVLPPSVAARLAVEAGASQGWHRYVGGLGDVVSVDRFGASAPGSEMLRHYGFTVDAVCARAQALLKGRVAQAHGRID